MKRRRRRRRSSGEEPQPTYIKFLAIAFGGAAIILAVVMGTRREKVLESRVLADDHSHAPAAAVPIRMDVKEIASHFICGCGSCNDLELATCTCGTAAQERQAIQEELDKGSSRQAVLQLVHDRYGGLKTEFAGFVKHR